MNTNITSALIKQAIRPGSDRYLGVISIMLLMGTATLVIVAMFAPELLIARY